MDGVMTLGMRIKTYFEIPTAAQVIKETRALTDQDKQDLIRYFNEAGMPTVLKSES